MREPNVTPHPSPPPPSAPDEQVQTAPGSSAAAHPSPSEGETGKKVPRWTIPFLRALERTGDVRASAEDAGIDHSTAYARRRAHPDFASNWDWVLQAHAERVEREKAEELERFHIPPHPDPHPPGERGEFASPAEERGASAQLKRAGHDRWSERKEKLFFDELAATANVRRAAKAAGVSTQAVFARRLRDSHFRAKWAAVLETGRATIEMHLVEAANRSFDPDELDTGDVVPKVSVAEAIRITQAHGSRKQELADPWEEDPVEASRDEIADIREGLVQKLQALRRRNRPALLARGWSFDESWDREIPPGWVKTTDWRPMTPEDMDY